ncbi:MAG: aminoacyl-histidine dipeptidase [Bacteroidales bacterium]|jgi:dipeptidase D|nr:aminoacyl-histidine dipeptidase [Bacteroidales bacterium]
MSKEILNLEPKAIWKHFYSLTQIPRPSKHEDEIQEFIVNFGNSLGLETIKDEVGNVIIRKPATSGMEDRKGVVLQGHLDMVPQKNSDKDHNWNTDSIDAIIDGDWVTADGTTLGADNGMGVAAAMAVLESTTMVHGPVEALLTSDEETGMTGAFGLKAGVMKGDILINMDSEDEGELYIGCAGGTNANAEFTYTPEPVPAGMKAYKLALTGLKGGHSGVDVPLQRGNSNKLLNRFLRSSASKFGLRLASIDGGSLRNAIPRESFATVVVPNDKSAEFEAAVPKCLEVFNAELEKTEPFMTFDVETTDIPENLIDLATQTALFNAIYACPNGVMRMSDSMEGLVETSNNVAIVKSKDGKISVLTLIRSSVDSAKTDLENMIESVFQMAGAKFWLDGQYPGWKPNVDSPILKAMSDIYNNKYGVIPKVTAIHAGLECGLFGGVYPNWDMISFGPTIRFPHSPDEKVDIASVQKFWDFTVEILKNIPKK